MTTAEPAADSAPDDAAENGMTHENSKETAATGESARIAELEQKLADANDKMLRAVAEADNTRKRLEKERQDTAKFAIASFARDLLGVADNLRRALVAITPEQRENNAELKNIAIGVEATERALLALFEKNGIRRIDPLGQVFDPNLHEVLFENEIPGKPAGTVVQVVEVGYTLHDRLLRPAKVGVVKVGSGAMEAGDTLDTNA